MRAGSEISLGAAVAAPELENISSVEQRAVLKAFVSSTLALAKVSFRSAPLECDRMFVRSPSLFFFLRALTFPNVVCVLVPNGYVKRSFRRVSLFRLPVS